MVTNWLKKLMGIDEIQNRVAQLEADKGVLESRVIESEQRVSLICTAAKDEVLSTSLIRYLKQNNIEMIGDASESALVAATAIELVDRYGFARYVVPVEDAIPSPVISLKDLHEHPEKYMPRLSKGFMNFPVGLNFDAINDLFRDTFGNIGIIPYSRKSNNGSLQFITSSLLDYKDPGKEETNNVMLAISNHTQLNQGKCGDWIYMNSLDFLANYDGMIRFFVENPGLSKGSKKMAVSALELAKDVYLAAMEIVGTTRVRDISELLDYESEKSSQNHELTVVNEGKYNDDLKSKIKESLLSEIKGTTYLEIQELLPIASKERFRELASARTSEILSSDRKYRSMTDAIGKPLEDYTVGESLLLACYFARHIIQRYETSDDAVRNVIDGNKEKGIGGKCTDFTALALHYLREFLVPLNPNNFENWCFGFDSDNIGDYNHCYMKAIHIDEGQNVDVYFLDPTQLSNKGIKSLKTPAAVAEAMDVVNLPLQITRVAEDLLYRSSE